MVAAQNVIHQMVWKNTYFKCTTEGKEKPQRNIIWEKLLTDGDSKDKHQVEQEGIMKERKKKKRMENRAIWERIILLMQYPL